MREIKNHVWICEKCGTKMGEDYKKCQMCLIYNEDLNAIKKFLKKGHYESSMPKLQQEIQGLLPVSASRSRRLL